MKVYFDTEFCNLWDPTPISFGFAADDGDDFYVEVIHDPAQHGDFVKRTIVPLLHGDQLTPFSASREIHDWLAHFRQPIELVCDFIGDYWILKRMMVHTLDVTPRCAYGAETGPVFKEHPELRQHHALDDARALRLLNPELQVE